MAFELFYEIADAGSAAARRFVVEHGLEARVRFRNLHYPEVEAAFRAHGGRTLPALWDGAVLHPGLAPVLSARPAPR